MSRRGRIVALLMLQAALCHFGRVSLSVAGAGVLMPVYGIPETTMGAIYSAYLLAYTLCMVPGGWLIDRRGPHAALLLVGVGSAVCLAVTGAVGMAAVPAAVVIPALIAIRAGAGVVAAPIHPAAARGIAIWIPAAARPLANGLVTGAALLGIASTYTAFGFLMDRLGWGVAFAVTGLATAAAAVLWATQSRRVRALEDARTPLDDDPSPAGSGLKFPVPGGDSPRPPALLANPGRARAPLLTLLRNRSILFLTLSYAAVGYVQYLFFYWMQFYFDRVLVLGKSESRVYATAATLAMAAGMIVGGSLAGNLERRLGRRRGRAPMALGAMLLAATFVAFGAAARAPGLVVGSFAVAMAAIGACESVFWTTATDLGGACGGTSAAIVNTGGNAGGALAPIVTPLVSAYIGWSGGLALAAAITILGALLWLRIDPADGAAPGPPRSPYPETAPC